MKPKLIVTMSLKDATAAVERHLDGRDDEERGSKGSVKPKLTVRKMVELEDGTLEVQRQEPNLLGGKLMRELVIRAVVPRRQEAQARKRFESVLDTLRG